MNTQDAFARMRAEWEHTCASPRAAELVRGWLAADGVAEAGTGAGGLDQLVRDLRNGGDQHSSDRWLRALLRRAVGTGSEAELAGRVVVQAMSPAALKTLRRLIGQYGIGRQDAAPIVLASLWEVVRRYPLERRPKRVALNIAWDTYRLASRELRCEQEALGSGTDPFDETALRQRVLSEQDTDHPVARAERSALAARVVGAGTGLEAYLDGGVEALSGARGELAELLVWALAEQMLEREGVRALAAHYREGAESDVAAARAARVSPAAWRKRRSRMVRQLRAAAPLWLLGQAA